MSKVTQIFVNLPIKDLGETMLFWRALGFDFNPQFTDENAACLVLGDNIFAMLLVEKYFRTFTTKETVDASEDAEVINAIQVGSRDEVNEMVEKAVGAGGKESREAQDHGWMYIRDFEDIDGHLWEIMWADLSKLSESV